MLQNILQSQNLDQMIQTLPQTGSLVSIKSGIKCQSKQYIPQISLNNPSNKRKPFHKQSFKQAEQIIENIKKTLTKNQFLCFQIHQKNPNYIHKLMQISPENYQLSQENIKIQQQKLLNILDRLYEQNCLLQKHLNKLKFLQQNQQRQKQEKQKKNLSHYSFLRNLWYQKDKIYKKQNNQIGNAQDILEKINKKVAMIRNNITLSINHEQKEQQFIRKSSSIETKIQQQFIVQSQKYQNLLKLFQKTKMRLQQLQSQQIQNSQKATKNICQSNFKKQIHILQKKLKNSEQNSVFLKQQISRLQKIVKNYQKSARNLKHLFSFSTQSKQNKNQIYQNQCQNQQNKQINDLSINLSLQQQPKDNFRQFRQSLSTLDMNKIIRRGKLNIFQTKDNLKQNALLENKDQIDPPFKTKDNKNLKKQQLVETNNQNLFYQLKKQQNQNLIQSLNLENLENNCDQISHKSSSKYSNSSKLKFVRTSKERNNLQLFR